MADSNRAQLAYVEETSYGVGVTGTTLQILRYNRSDIKLTVDHEESEEIRTDRQLADIQPIRHNVGGGIDFELSYLTHDDLFAAAQGASAWSSVQSVSGTTISAASADNSFNDSGSGFGSIVANQWIKVSGFTTSANNGYFKVSTATSAKLVVTGGTLTTEAAGDSVTIQMGPQIVDGTTETTFNFEEDFKDLTTTLSLFKGCGVSGFDLSMPAEGKVTGRFEVVGATEEELTSSKGSGYVAATTNRIMYDTHLQKVLEGGTSLTTHEWSIEYRQILNQQVDAGSAVPSGLTQGSISCKGRLTAYFTSTALYTKFLNNTQTSLTVVFEDAAGNGILFDMPEVIFTDGGKIIEGKDGDIMADIEWTARADNDESIMCRIARFAA